jgi:hypothetical protein
MTIVSEVIDMNDKREIGTVDRGEQVLKTFDPSAAHSPISANWKGRSSALPREQNAQQASTAASVCRKNPLDNLFDINASMARHHVGAVANARREAACSTTKGIEPRSGAVSGLEARAFNRPPGHEGRFGSRVTSIAGPHGGAQQ